MRYSILARMLCAFAVGLPCAASLHAQVRDYDIVYVRQVRFGDSTNTTWPEVFHPARLDPGADLMLLHPDGSEEVLVAGGIGGVTDPFVSFDGGSVYYSWFPDLRPQSLNPQRDNLPLAGADIYRIDLATRQIQRLTHGEFTPNTGAGNWLESNPVDPPPAFNRRNRPLYPPCVSGSRAVAIRLRAARSAATARRYGCCDASAVA